MDPKLSLAGLLVGVLVGMTGMGGGSLLTPMLVLLFGFKPTIAIGTDILHGAIFKSVGAWRHRKLGQVHARLGLWMFLGSAPFSLVGVWVATLIGDSAEDLQKAILGVALVVCGVGFFAKTLVGGKDGDGRMGRLKPKQRVIAIVLGITGGFVVGLTSVGSGTFFALVMLLAFPLSVSRIVGTDIFHAAALLWVAGSAHLFAGNVDLAAMGSLLVGSIPGVLLGSNVTVKLPERTLRYAFATVLLLCGVKLLDPPGSDYVVVVGLVVGAVLLTLSAMQELRRPTSPERPRTSEDVPPSPGTAAPD